MRGLVEGRARGAGAALPLALRVWRRLGFHIALRDLDLWKASANSFARKTLQPVIGKGISRRGKMDTALVLVERPALPVEFAEELQLASDFARASKAKATQDAYASDFRIFEAWCRQRGLSALPATAATVCAVSAAPSRSGQARVHSRPPAGEHQILPWHRR
jgi:hypothetical protein